jgi:hypothetical protein
MIKQIPWSAAAESHMRHEAAGQCIPYLRAEVEAGVAKLWHCKDDVSEAYMVTRFDRNPDELVVCYFEGQGMQKFCGQFVNEAHARGITVRAHTTQPLVARLVRRIGFTQSEFVLRAAPRKSA